MTLFLQDLTLSSSTCVKRIHPSQMEIKKGNLFHLEWMQLQSWVSPAQTQLIQLTQLTQLQTQLTQLFRNL
jgi:hypothetical protein